MLEYEQCLGVYHREVEKFKKQLLRTTLEEHRGNRTRAARALGLQRTYFLRLIRNFEIDVPREWER